MCGGAVANTVSNEQFIGASWASVLAPIQKVDLQKSPRKSSSANLPYFE